MPNSMLIFFSTPFLIHQSTKVVSLFYHSLCLHQLLFIKERDYCIWFRNSQYEVTIYKYQVGFALQQQILLQLIGMQALKSSSKKLYQYILSTKEPSQLLRDSLCLLLRSTVESQEHFDFLLHRVNWFESPFTHYQQLFIKILRIYRSKSKQSSRVIYNLLIESFINPTSTHLALQCLTQLFEESYDKKTIIQCLKENYPHKLCSLEAHMFYLNNMIQLCNRFKDYRMDFLEIIIEHFVNFDTELILADEWVHKPFPEDQKIIALRDKAHQNEISLKFDQLLLRILKYLDGLEEDEKIMGQILLIFQNKVLPIKTTKLIQCIVFNVAESSKARANAFISFLLANIFDTNHKQNFYRIFTQSNFYLFSYIIRSKRLSKNTIVKILRLMIARFHSRLQEIPSLDISEKTNLKDIYIQNQMHLLTLQTIIILRINYFQVHDLDLNDQYLKLLSESHKKLRFQYFIREDILHKIGIDKKDNKKNLAVKFSNKFLPATLPNVGILIDSKMKVYQLIESNRNLLEQMKQLQPICRKLHKGQTPVSHCSQTIII